MSRHTSILALALSLTAVASGLPIPLPLPTPGQVPAPNSLPNQPPTSPHVIQVHRVKGHRRGGPRFVVVLVAMIALLAVAFWIRRRWRLYKEAAKTGRNQVVTAWVVPRHATTPASLGERQQQQGKKPCVLDQLSTQPDRASSRSGSIGEYKPSREQSGDATGTEKATKLKLVSHSDRSQELEPSNPFYPSGAVGGPCYPPSPHPSDDDGLGGGDNGVPGDEKWEKRNDELRGYSPDASGYYISGQPCPIYLSRGGDAGGVDAAVPATPANGVNAAKDGPLDSKNSDELWPPNFPPDKLWNRCHAAGVADTPQGPLEVNPSAELWPPTFGDNAASKPREYTSGGGDSDATITQAKGGGSGATVIRAGPPDVDRFQGVAIPTPFHVVKDSSVTATKEAPPDLNRFQGVAIPSPPPVDPNASGGGEVEGAGPNPNWPRVRQLPYLPDPTFETPYGYVGEDDDDRDSIPDAVFVEGQREGILTWIQHRVDEPEINWPTTATAVIPQPIEAAQGGGGHGHLGIVTTLKPETRDERMQVVDRWAEHEIMRRPDSNFRWRSPDRPVGDWQRPDGLERGRVEASRMLWRTSYECPPKFSDDFSGE